MKIGIFDSGHGGRLVAKKLQILVPQHSYEVVDDQTHAPYGERETEDIKQLTEIAIQPLLATCTIIILACNTATAAAIDYLREKYKEVTFLGFEPMIKPAGTRSKSRHITLLATRATTQAERTKALAKLYAKDCIIDTPDTTNWARLIDHQQAQAINLDEVQQSVLDGSDTIIIGCTHYISLEKQLASFGVTVLEPTIAVARQLERIIASVELRQ